MVKVESQPSQANKSLVELKSLDNRQSDFNRHISDQPYNSVTFRFFRLNGQVKPINLCIILYKIEYNPLCNIMITRCNVIEEYSILPRCAMLYR